MQCYTHSVKRKLLIGTFLHNFCRSSNLFYYIEDLLVYSVKISFSAHIIKKMCIVLLQTDVSINFDSEKIPRTKLLPRVQKATLINSQAFAYPPIHPDDYQNFAKLPSLSRIDGIQLTPRIRSLHDDKQLSTSEGKAIGTPITTDGHPHKAIPPDSDRVDFGAELARAL